MSARRYQNAGRESALLGGSWDLISKYLQLGAHTLTYSLRNWPCIGYPNGK